MTIADYERQAAGTAVYPSGSVYPYLGLIEEVGEVAGVLAKAERDNGGALDDERREQLLKELGDLLWMLAAVARAAGGSLADELERDEFRLLSGMREDDAYSAELLVSILSGYAANLLNYWANEVRVDWQLPIVRNALIVWERLCFQLSFEPVAVARANLEKLASRAERGVLQGAGDDR